MQHLNLISLIGTNQKQNLKILLNIVDAQIKRVLKSDVCEINAVTIKISMTELISPLNKQSGSPSILQLQSMGEMSNGIFGNLHIFALLKHLIMILRCNFFSSGLHFYTLSQTLVTCRAMQLRNCLKWKHC